MKLRLLLFLAISVASWACPLRAARFEEFFTGATARLELRQVSGAGGAHVSVEGARVEGLWPGNRARLRDSSNRGAFRFEIVDLETDTLLYSRGVGSSHQASTDIPRSLRFPEPRSPFVVRLSRQLPNQTYEEIWSSAFDPQSRLFDRSEIGPQRVWVLFENGPALGKVDLLILGEGYTPVELPRYHADVGRLVASLFSIEPFAANRSAFNVRVVDTTTASPGVARRGSEEQAESPLGGILETTESGREVLSFDDGSWREVAAVLPYDFVIILVNSKQNLSAGGYQQFAAVAAGSPISESLLAHQFGHHFAGLGDEDCHRVEEVGEDLDPEGPLLADDRWEPWEPNLTALLDRESLKWNHLLDPEIPLPTPWDRASFAKQLERIQEERQGASSGVKPTDFASLRPAERLALRELLDAEEFAGKIGAFEGVGASSERCYRPATNCLMFVGHEAGYCKVCRYAIERVLRRYTQ